MKNYNISHDLICSIKGLYSNATSAVFNNGSIGEWFQASVGVRQGCLLSPTLFNIFLERNMTDALDGHAGTVSIGGRPLTNLRFADDIDGLAGSEEELRELLGRLEKASKDYGMEISGEKTKIMMNNINGMTTALHIAGNTLDEVQSFKYLGAIISEEGSTNICKSHIFPLYLLPRIINNVVRDIQLYNSSHSAIGKCVGL